LVGNDIVEKQMIHALPFLEAISYPMLVVEYRDDTVLLSNPYITYRFTGMPDIERIKEKYPPGSVRLLFGLPHWLLN